MGLSDVDNLAAKAIEDKGKADSFNKKDMVCLQSLFG
jgi:hypothetical protein